MLRGSWMHSEKTRLALQVINGKGQMPAWDTVLDDEEIQAVAEYVYATAGKGW
jgi:mono/diheme cytochrome c family protein